MISKKRLGALLLAGTMIMGMSTTAFASGETQNTPQVGTGTEQAPASASITKDFEMAEGLEIPTVTFNFSVSADKSNSDAPKATIEPISYSNADNKGNLTDQGKYVISKNMQITFGTFPHAGEYLYTVEETKGDAKGVTYSTDKYTLRVQVANGANDSLYVKSITAEKGTNTGNVYNKVTKILFTNTYRKNGSLTIEKNTTGDLADKTMKFDFTITFEKSATEETLGDFTGTITRKNGGKPETVSGQNGIFNFALADGDKIVFDKLPVGTKYEVKEKGVSNDGYTPSVTVWENNISSQKNGNESEDLSSLNKGKKNLVGEATNKVTFVNTYRDDVPVTGIIMNNLPFILLIGVAVLAFGTLAFLKKRRTSK